MKPHHVNSKTYLLSNPDILLVAAHDHPEDAKMHYKNAGSPPQATPVMLLTAIFNQIFVAPHSIRLREGNTLFVLNPGPKGAMMFMFDADTPNNTVRNMATACEAARKMGFTKLVFPATDNIAKKLGKRAFDKNHKKGDKYSETKNIVTVELAHV